MRRALSIAALAALVASVPASAQRASSSSSDMPIELGVDAGFGSTSRSGGGSSVTAISIPTGSVRAGFFISPVMSIEPSFSYHSASTSGFSESDYNATVGLLYHFSADRRQNQLYVRPFVGISGGSQSSGGTSTSSSDIDFGAGIGMKFPWMDRISWRGEVGVDHVNSNPSTNTIYLLAGISLYTR